MSNNITSQVQQGETLSLYAKMYNCSVEELQKLNKLSNGELKVGSTLIIPIGKKPPETKQSNDIMQQKLDYFDTNLNELHMKLFDPDLKPSEREKLEQKYIDMKNLKKERAEVADIKISHDGKSFELNMKKQVSVNEFRRLFPECCKNFKDYAKETKQYQYKNGKGFIYDPNHIQLKVGKPITLEYDEYSREVGKGFLTIVADWFRSLI